LEGVEEKERKKRAGKKEVLKGYCILTIVAYILGLAQALSDPESLLPVFFLDAFFLLYLYCYYE
jgi:hypothetical protein